MQIKRQRLQMDPDVPHSHRLFQRASAPATHLQRLNRASFRPHAAQAYARAREPFVLLRSGSGNDNFENLDVSTFSAVAASGHVTAILRRCGTFWLALADCLCIVSRLLAALLRRCWPR